MPHFSYKSVNPSGEVSEGSLEAASQGEAISKLYDLGLTPIRVIEGGKRRSSGVGLLKLTKRASIMQVATFTRELSVMLKAGLPLDRAMQILISLSGQDAVMNKPLTQVLEEVKGGSSLAEAMERQPSLFDPFYVSLVRAGEIGGALNLVLERLSESLERSKEVRDSLLSAFIYPAILFFVAILSVIILLVYVLPQFTELFDSMGAKLPLATQFVIALGDGVRNYGWVGLVLILLIWWAIRYQLGTLEGRLRWHTRLIRLPVMGDLLLKVEVSRFARTLGTLLSNGVPLLRGITIVRDVVGNQVIANGLGEVINNIKQGGRLAQLLHDHTPFPSFAIHMIQVGEESGNLDEMLIQVADVFDKETKTAIQRALALMEPILILTLGLIIAGIVMSILVAILGVNQLVF